MKECGVRSHQEERGGARNGVKGKFKPSAFAALEELRKEGCVSRGVCRDRLGRSRVLGWSLGPASAGLARGGGSRWLRAVVSSSLSRPTWALAVGGCHRGWHKYGPRSGDRLLWRALAWSVPLTGWQLSAPSPPRSPSSCATCCHHIQFPACWKQDIRCRMPARGRGSGVPVPHPQAGSFAKH